MTASHMAAIYFVKGNLRQPRADCGQKSQGCRGEKRENRANEDPIKQQQGKRSIPAFEARFSSNQSTDSNQEPFGWSLWLPQKPAVLNRT